MQLSITCQTRITYFLLSYTLNSVQQTCTGKVIIVIIVELIILRSSYSANTVLNCPSQKEVPFSMDIRNMEHIHECVTQHLRMGTAIIIKDEETEKRGKQGENVEGS